MTHDTPKMDCTGTPVCDTRFGGESSRSVSVAIVEALAAAENVGPTQIDPLADEIDLEALETLVTSSDTSDAVAVRVSLSGWNVFVRSDGVVRVYDPDSAAGAHPVFEQEAEC